MSSQMIHELFRGLERTIHERLEMIEELVRRGPTNVSSPVESEKRESPDMEGILRGQQYLLSRIDAVEEELRHLTTENKRTPLTLIPPHPLVGIEVTAPEQINAADSLLLNNSARKHLETSGDLFPAEEEAEEEVEEEVEEVEEEAEEEELEEFEFKGVTYYKDTELNVYKIDENGELVTEPIGVWSTTKNKIIF